MQAPRKESNVSVITEPSHDPWLSVPEAAREIGIANATVLQLALRGELKTMVAAKRTLVDRASVEAYKARAESAAAAASSGSRD